VELDPKAPNTGKWVDEPCTKSNLVVCQNGQRWSREHMQQMILDLRQNILPIGYIHVQLPGQPEPKTLWPKMDWENVSPAYAGLFFRTEGGNSNKFNDKIQEGDSPRLVMVDSHYDNKNWTQWASIITPGVYSNDVYTGTNGGPVEVYQNYLVSLAEVRPRNQAIRIWKRIQ